MRQKGNLEVEIRFKVSDAKKLRAALRRLGFRCLERWRGRDVLFDRPSRFKSRFGRESKDGELIPVGKLLRLRLGMERSGRGKLTFKRPCRDHPLAGGFKVREEFETIVEKPEMAIKILAGLGYESVIEYEKRTELWVPGSENSARRRRRQNDNLPNFYYPGKYGGAEIYVEELPAIGCFMEIEGSEKNIKKLAEILGYDTKKGIKKSYRECYAELDKKKKRWLFRK